MGKVNLSQASDCGDIDEVKIPKECEEKESYSCQSLDKCEDIIILSRQSLDKDTDLATCRVCQCVESDKRGDAGLGFLGIIPSLPESARTKAEEKADIKGVQIDYDESENSVSENIGRESSQVVEFISPDGESLIYDADLEMGSCQSQDILIELGCACKGDLALVHYACALKWFLTRGSTVCEICGCVAKNINVADFQKVVAFLKEYETLRERTASGEPNRALLNTSSSVDLDSLAAIRRQRLNDIFMWFTPSGSSDFSAPASVLHILSEPSLSTGNDNFTRTDNLAIKWIVEGTGILFATGFLTAIIVWLVAPHVGKKTVTDGLHILFGGICALAAVVFFRFFVLTRIKYGPARYWAILFVFWFIVLAIWTSRAHDAQTT